MSPERITQRETFFLLCLFLWGNLITGSGAKGKQGGWILLLLLALLSVPTLLLYAKATNGKQPGTVFIRPLGKILGGILTVLYSILAILIAGDAIRVFADFLVINDLNNAGALGNSALLSICVMLLLFCNIRSLGKAAWLLFLPITALLLCSFLLSIGEMQLHRLLPLLNEEYDILQKSLIGGFVAGAAPAFFPIAAICGAESEQRKRGLICAGLFSGLLLAILAVRDVSVLGVPVISLFRFPSFVAAATQRHSEVLISAAFVLAQPFKAALCLRYVLECMSSWKPAGKRWYPPILLGLAVLSGAFSWSSQQVRWRTTGELVVSAFLLAGPLAVVLIEKIQKRHCT